MTSLTNLLFDRFQCAGVGTNRFRGVGTIMGIVKDGDGVLVRVVWSRAPQKEKQRFDISDLANCLCLCRF